MTKQMAQFIPDSFDALLLGVGELVPTGPHGRAVLAGLCKRLNDHPRAVQVRYEAALVEASGFYSGSTRKIGEQLAADLRRYDQNDWRRKDHRLDAYPESPFRTLKACFFDMLKAGGEKSARGGRQIGDTLKRCLTNENHGNILCLAVSDNLPDIHDGAELWSNSEMGDQRIDTKKFLIALQESEIGKDIINKSHTEIVAERQKIIDALAANEAKAEKDFPLRTKAIEAAIAKVREVGRVWQAANDDLNRASYARSSASLAHTSERHRLQGLLWDTEYSETITDFQREMRWGMDDVRKQYDFYAETSVNALTGESMLRRYSNRASVDARISAMREAIDQADALRLIADQSNVPEQLAAIRAGLPKVLPAVDPLEKRA
jgi:hypothetical protein